VRNLPEKTERREWERSSFPPCLGWEGEEVKGVQGDLVRKKGIFRYIGLTSFGGKNSLRLLVEEKI